MEQKGITIFYLSAKLPASNFYCQIGCFYRACRSLLPLAETILQVEVDKDDKAISVVEAVHIRDRDFEPFAFRINEDVLPELVEPYLSKEKKSGRPTKEPFDPEREIPEHVHRAAVDAAFANGNIGSYDDYLERLKETYGLHNVKFGYNKAVKVTTFLGNKRMVIKEGKNYTHLYTLMYQSVYYLVL